MVIKLQIVTKHCVIDSTMIFFQIKMASVETNKNGVAHNVMTKAPWQVFYAY